MKTLKILVLMLIVVPFISLSQTSDIIEINNTSITSPVIYDFGTVDSIVYTKYIIKNNRSSAVEIKDTRIPSGFFIDFSDMTILPNKKITLYVGLDPRFVDFTGKFEKKIILKTNLIADIEIILKGEIK